MNRGLHPNNFFILESCSRKPRVDFLFAAKYVFLLLTRDLKQFNLYIDFVYLSKCVHAIACFLKIPVKLKIFLSIALLQRTTNDSCLCCSLVWKMNSQILTGIEKINNEVSTIFKGKKFFVMKEGVDSHNSRPELLFFAKLTNSKLFLLIPVEL